jgi:hypothetical protein
MLFVVEKVSLVGGRLDRADSSRDKLRCAAASLDPPLDAIDASLASLGADSLISTPFLHSVSMCALPPIT